MPDVLLDGVKFAFPDVVPASLSEVRARLEETLAERGRVLAGFWLNGQPFDESIAETALAEGARVEATSLALADALAQAGAALAPEFIALQGEADALAAGVLRAAWPDVQPKCVQLLEATAQAMQRAVDIAALRGEGDKASTAVATLANAIESWMAGVQQADAGQVCLCLDGAVVPALAGVATALQEPPRS